MQCKLTPHGTVVLAKPLYHDSFQLCRKRLFALQGDITLEKGLRVTDSKYRESLDRFEKSKTLKLCLKNAFREFSSKILFRFSKNLTSSRNSQKTKIHLFTSLNMQKNIRKIDKVLGIRIETIYNFRTRVKLSTKVSPFFYLTIGSFNFFK